MSSIRLEWDGKRRRTTPSAELTQVAHVPASETADGGEANRLLLGDCLGVMENLRPEFEGRLDLIYVDPPFLSGKAYRARTGTGEDSRRPQEWTTTLGFDDTWDDPSEYLNVLFEALASMHALLASHGTLYLHLDWHAAAYGKLLLDEIFGAERLLNEIIWVYHGPSPIRSAFKRKHDTLYVYAKSSDYKFNADAVRVPYDESTRKTFASSAKAGFGKQPDLDRGKVPEDWWYFPVVARLHKERTGYPTQKPEALLERIILASSDPGDWVADFFCGSGTTPAVAERLDRRWLACDVAPLAVNTARRRMLLGTTRRDFTVWQEAAHAGTDMTRPEVRLAIEGLTAHLELVEDDAGLASLELDWNFDGQLFRSRSRSAREWRSDEIQRQHSHRYDVPGRYTIAARTLSQDGRVGMTTSEVVLR